MERKYGLSEGSLDGFGSKKDPLNEIFPEQKRIVKLSGIL
jgi:hypothetical protein